MQKNTVTLDGNSLTREQLVAVARHGAGVALDEAQLVHVQRAADFLADKVSCGEPIYGVTTGFGSNADKLLGAHRARDELPGGNPEQRDGSLLEELQHNLVVTHAVCVGKPFAADVVRPAAHEWDEREETPWPIISEAAKIGLYGFEGMAQFFADPRGLGLPIVNAELFWGDAGLGLSIMGTAPAAAAEVGGGSARGGGSGGGGGAGKMGTARAGVDVG